MLDVTFVIKNMEFVKQALNKRNFNALLLDELAEIHRHKNKLIYALESLQQQSNQDSKQISILKKNKVDITNETKKLGLLRDAMKQKKSELEEVCKKEKTQMAQIPNLPQDIIVEIEKRHCSDTQLIKRASYNTVSKYNRCLYNYAMDFFGVQHDYIELIAPAIAKDSTLTNTFIAGIPINKKNFFIYESAVGVVVAQHENETIHTPLKYVMYSPVFEKKEQDILQTNQLELVVFSSKEQVIKTFSSLVQNVIDFLDTLGVPYYLQKVPIHKLAFSKATSKEIWIQRGQSTYEKWAVISYESDFIARNLNIRYRNAQNKLCFVHTMCCTGMDLAQLTRAMQTNCMKTGN